MIQTRRTDRLLGAVETGVPPLQPKETVIRDLVLAVQRLQSRMRVNELLGREDELGRRDQAAYDQATKAVEAALLWGARGGAA